MFESDDYDQILSQLDLPESINTHVIKADQQDNSKEISKHVNEKIPISKKVCSPPNVPNCTETIVDSITLKQSVCDTVEVNNKASHKHTKRKLINSYFDHKSKRKFPGPAGLLNGTFEESKEDDICHVELLSQDIDYTQSYLHKGIFESPLWIRLHQDSQSLNKVDTIKCIQQQALKGNLRRRKAENIIAFVESVDRSAIDPQIVLRDTTGSIKCTLHRDAWVAFSPYIVSECCALILCNPTVLTTGSAFKKHYLNITLSNIHAVYSSAIVKSENESLPNGFRKVFEDDYTIIENEKQYTGTNTTTELVKESNLLEDLDAVFSDDIF